MRFVARQRAESVNLQWVGQQLVNLRWRSAGWARKNDNMNVTFDLTLINGRNFDCVVDHLGVKLDSGHDIL